jgi:hypothetical protein
MADLKDSFRAANPGLLTPDQVAIFLWNVSGNGTFVFDASDLIADRHAGFGDVSAFKPEALVDADGVGYLKPQTYTCWPKTVGNANIFRRFIGWTISIRKVGP